MLPEDQRGPVAIYPLPYLEPGLVADVLGAERSHTAVLRAAAERVRQDLRSRPAGTRSVVAAHAFVVGGAASDSERDISVGGVGQVPASVFDGLDYVALGHLHGRQRLAETVRYSGSPLAYSFSEAGHTKGGWLASWGRAASRPGPPSTRRCRVQPLARLSGRWPTCSPMPATGPQSRPGAR